MATHSSILAWRIPWTEVPSRLQSMGPQESDCVRQHLHFGMFKHLLIDYEECKPLL